MTYDYGEFNRHCITIVESMRSNQTSNDSLGPTMAQIIRQRDQQLRAIYEQTSENIQTVRNILSDIENIVQEITDDVSGLATTDETVQAFATHQPIGIVGSGYVGLTRAREQIEDELQFVTEAIDEIVNERESDNRKRVQGMLRFGLAAVLFGVLGLVLISNTLASRFSAVAQTDLSTSQLAGILFIAAAALCALGLFYTFSSRDNTTEQSAIGARRQKSSIKHSRTMENALFYGLDCLEQRNYSAAIESFSKFLGIHIDNDYGYRQRGIAYYLSGKPEDAVSDFTRAIERNQFYAESYANRAAALDSLNETDRATVDRMIAAGLDAKIGTLSGMSESSAEKSHIRFGKATRKEINDIKESVSAYMENEDYESAITELNRAIIARPDDAELHLDRGLAWFLRGNVEAAILDYTEAVQRVPDQIDAYYNRAEAYAQTGKIPEAIMDYSQVIRLNPDDTMARLGRGLLYVRTEDWKKAITDLTEYIQVDNTDATVFNNRGWAYHQLQNLDDAIRDYTNAIKLQPKLTEAYVNRGLALSEGVNIDEAIDDFRKSLELDPSMIQVYCYRGETY